MTSLSWPLKVWAEGAAAKGAFAERLSKVEAVVQNQDNREHDLLDSDDYYQFEGGAAAAVQHLQGAARPIYHNDHSRPERPVIRGLDEEIGRVIRSRVVNPKWIDGVKRHTTVITDQARYIRESVSAVIETAITGGVLAVIILFLFLRSFKTTLIIAAIIAYSNSFEVPFLLDDIAQITQRKEITEEFDWEKTDHIVETAERYGGLDLLIRVDHQPKSCCASVA